MTFLNPWLLFGLALMSLPIIIHLLNRRRHRTMHWGAMMFLLNATRQSKGHARLKHLLILLCRMLAVGALIFAIARPIAGGWLGWLGSTAPDTIIVILDRSASMEGGNLQQDLSKRESAVQRLSEVLDNYDSSPRIVLIESTGNAPQLLRSAKDLEELPAASATDTSADIPGMIQKALDYIVDNKAGKTEVWIASDLQESDWDPDGNRWEAIKVGVKSLKQEVTFQTLTFSDVNPDDISIRVTELTRLKTATGSDLLISVNLKRTGTTPKPVLVTFNLGGGNPTSQEIEMTDKEYTLKQHRIPLGESEGPGYGWVSIPSSTTSRNNRFYFSFSEEVPLKSVVVSEDNSAAKRLQLVAAPPLPGSTATCEIIAPAAATTINWDEIGLVLWQAPLPSDSVARQLEKYLATGGAVVFFPPGPEESDQGEFMGLSWGGLESSEETEEGTITPEPDDDDRRPYWKVETVRTDEGPLRRTDAGRLLPVTEIRTLQRRSFTHQGEALASYADGKPFLVRMTPDSGSATILVCATRAEPSFSNLSRNGIVLFAVTRRSLDSGAQRLGKALTIITGDKPNIDPTVSWKHLSGDPKTDPVDSFIDYRINAGVFEAGGKIIAQNRPAAEDDPSTIDPRLLETKLFQGLKHRNIETKVEDEDSLISEIWKFFIIAMIAFLLGEAVLCLPEPARKEVSV